jgi:hypothetical protein
MARLPDQTDGQISGDIRMRERHCFRATTIPSRTSENRFQY